MSDGKIKGILFDLGETLITFGKVNTYGLFLEGARLSYDFIAATGAPVGSYFLYAMRNLFRLRLSHIVSGITGNDFDSVELLRKINEPRGIKLTDEQWHEVAWLWYEPLSRYGRFEADIVQTFSTLKAMGLRLGIVSNTFVPASALERHLEMGGILKFFDVRMYSYQFEFRKPDLKIFEAAADRIGVEFENLIYVGDRIDNDVNPSLKLNITAVLKDAYTNAGKTTPAGAYRIGGLCELPALVEKLNS